MVSCYVKKKIIAFLLILLLQKWMNLWSCDMFFVVLFRVFSEWNERKYHSAIINHQFINGNKNSWNNKQSTNDDWLGNGRFIKINIINDKEKCWWTNSLQISWCIELAIVVYLNDQLWSLASLNVINVEPIYWFCRFSNRNSQLHTEYKPFAWISQQLRYRHCCPIDGNDKNWKANSKNENPFAVWMGNKSKHIDVISYRKLKMPLTSTSGEAKRWY